MLFDSHCHLDFSEFDIDRDEVVSNCQQSGLTGIIVPGVSRDSWDNLLEVCQRYPLAHAALGMHPYFLARHSLSDLDILQDYIVQHNPVAIGEIGLDYAMPELGREEQRLFFESQLKLAKLTNLPVIVHARKSHADVLEAIKRSGVRSGVIHAYSGSEQQAIEYTRLGLKLGFGGAMTWARSTRLRSLASNLPLESVVLETDSPEMPPEGRQGTRNSPEYLPEIFELFCSLRYESKEEIATQLMRNVNKVFCLPI